MSACKSEECDRQSDSKGYCRRHYMRLYRHGSPDVVKKVARHEERVCSIDGCGRETRARGWCQAHWERWNTNGDPGADIPHRFDLTEAARFELHYRRGAEADCWEWLGGLTSPTKQDPNGGGYGKFRSGGRTCLAHRFAYTQAKGPIPDGLTIDHRCRNRRCVNPSHHEAVPQRVNTLRGTSFAAENAKKTHCVHGHAFSVENTRVYQYNGTAHRSCRTCARISAATARKANA